MLWYENATLLIGWYHIKAHCLYRSNLFCYYQKDRKSVVCGLATLPKSNYLGHSIIKCCLSILILLYPHLSYYFNDLTWFKDEKDKSLVLIYYFSSHLLAFKHFFGFLNTFWAFIHFCFLHRLLLFTLSLFTHFCFLHFRFRHFRFLHKAEKKQ